MSIIVVINYTAALSPGPSIGGHTICIMWDDRADYRATAADGGDKKIKIKNRYTYKNKKIIIIKTSFPVCFH